MPDVREALVHLACGAGSGAFADLASHPLSTLKTRLQVQGATAGTADATAARAYSGSFHALRVILTTEGVGALYKGVGAVVAGAAPATALYFAGLEGVKKTLPGGDAANFASGMAGQVCGSLAWVPMDVVKERLQVEGQVAMKESYGGSLNAARHIVAAEGVRGLYRAYWMHQLTWAPFNGIMIAAFVRFKRLLRTTPLGGPLRGRPDGDATVGVVAGAGAGAVAAVATAPIDLVKTRLQVQRSNPTLFDYHGAADATLKVFRREGPLAFFDGVGARVLWLVPRMTLAVMGYDVLKTALTGEAL